MRWIRYYDVWMDGPFEYLEPHFVESKTEEFLKEFQKTQKYYRNRIKADMLENTLCKFKVILLNSPSLASTQRYTHITF